jgi:phage shock protein C
MYCTKCGVELRDDDRFCSRCGNRIAVNTVNIETEIRGPLLLDKCNKKVAGVCAGFARYLGVDVVLMRVIWLGVALCTGVGFLAYLAAWIVIPGDARYATRDVMAQGHPQTS